MSTLLVINTLAGRAREKIDFVSDYFSDEGIKTILIKSDEEFDVELAKLRKSKPKKVIVAGGDGTIIRVIEQLYQEYPDCVYGIVPIGTANYFARNVYGTTDVQEACQHSLSSEAIPVRVGVIGDKLFALSLKIGFWSEVIDKTSTELKRRFKQLAYGMSAARTSLSHKSFDYKVYYGGEVVEEGRAQQILAVNARVDDVVKLVPDSSMLDSELKISIYKSRNTVLLFLSFALYVMSAGRINRDIKMLTGDEFKIEIKPEVRVAIDGDVVESRSPIEIRSHDKPVLIAKKL